MGKRLIIALGGNALGLTPGDQERSVEKVAKILCDLVEDEYEIAISHGNGPQVGMINLAFSESSKIDGKIPEMPLPECTAMSQGYIGYHLQKALTNEFSKRGIKKEIVGVITQVAVDPSDPAFENPTKPIGTYYEASELSKIRSLHPSWVILEDAGRGYRRVVPSPMPKKILEKDTISKLMSNGHVVISCGGGGVPVVVEGDGRLCGVDAVIDKDLASELLAESLEADIFLILTAVDRVKINYGRPDEKSIENMTVEEAEVFCAEGHFAPGSMLPKVRAAMRFANSKYGRRAIISSLEKAAETLRGKSGTVIKA